MIKNNRFKIKTPFGYSNFQGITKSTHTNYKQIITEDNMHIKCSGSHIFWNHDNIEIIADNLEVGSKILSDNNVKTIKSIKTIESKNTLMYDIIETDNDENSFLLSNKIKTHNCAFLSFEKILIDSEFLDFIQTPPIISEEMGFEIYKDSLESPDSIILITSDPSAGGDDNSVIILWEITPSKIYQLASCADPDLDASGIFEKILWLQELIRARYNAEPMDALIIFERNGVGEGLVQILTQTEKAMEHLEIPIFYDKRGIPGVQLNPTMKKKLAIQFKNLMEYNKIQVNDSKLIDELYGFIRNPTTGNYSAKSGYTDDRIMATFYLVFFIIEVFSLYADGDFTVDKMMLVKEEDRVKVESREEIDPATIYREKLEKQKEQEAKDLAYYQELAQMGSSSIVEDDDDDVDIDGYDILPVVI